MLLTVTMKHKTGDEDANILLQTKRAGIAGPLSSYRT